MLQPNPGKRESVEFGKAIPLQYDASAFSVRIDKGQAKIVLNDHHATKESARAVVEPYLRTWELSAALFCAADKFEFVFTSADIIARRPTPELTSVVVDVGIGMEVALSKSVSRSKYPDPPLGLACDSDVALMFYCYRSYCNGRRTLADAAYFCLTVLVHSAGGNAIASITLSPATTQTPRGFQISVTCRSSGIPNLPVQYY